MTLTASMGESQAGASVAVIDDLAVSGTPQCQLRAPRTHGPAGRDQGRPWQSQATRVPPPHVQPRCGSCHGPTLTERDWIRGRQTTDQRPDQAAPVRHQRDHPEQFRLNICLSPCTTDTYGLIAGSTLSMLPQGLQSQVVFYLREPPGRAQTSGRAGQRPDFLGFKVLMEG
jgi:hypothetical protein